MKKSLLFLFVGLFTTITSSLTAQTCTPDNSFNSAGNYPDTLPASWVDSTYFATITHVVPLDTTVEVFGAPVDVTVDSVKIIDLQGLPSGFSYSCNPGDCVFIGGSTGCTAAMGTAPDSSLIGVYPLEIYTETTAHSFFTALPPQYDTVFTYYIEIRKYGTSSTINKIDENNTLELLNNYPNPAQTNNTLSFYTNRSSYSTIRIIDLLGNTVKTQNVVTKQGINQYLFDVSTFNNGIYFYEITSGSNSQVQRLVVSN